MKKNSKKEKQTKRSGLLVIAIILLIIAAAIIALTIKSNNSTKKEPFKIDGIETLDDKELLKDTTIEGLSITKQVLYSRDGLSNYNAIVTNTTESTKTIDTLYVTFTVKEESKKISVLQNVTLEPNGKTTINLSFDTDMKDVTDIEFSLK